MTQLAAICASLLKGDVLTIMSGYKLFACSNLPRELSRGVEQKFGVTISKDQVNFTSQYGQRGFYYRYRLNRIPANEEGITKMVAYIQEQLATEPPPKTDKEAKIHRQLIQTTMF